MRGATRSGTHFVFIAIVVFLIAVVIGYFAFASVYQPVQGLMALFFITLIIGFVCIGMGVFNLSRGSDFNNRVRRLKQSGYVERGSIVRVSSGYFFLGRTRGTNDGDSAGGMDTGWFFRVTYVFEDPRGGERRAIGLVPDFFGPKRQNTNNQSAIDPHRPRIGMRVDVLFDNYDSVMLRTIPAT